MKRAYVKMKVLETEILEMKAQGKTKAEIAEHFGLSFEQVKRLLYRYNRRQRDEKEVRLPKRKGRPPKSVPESIAAKDRLIAQLQMENELLRDFLAHTGRG